MNETLIQLRRVVMDAPGDLFHMRAIVDHTSRGTARCTLGWALIDSWFLERTEIGKAIPPTWDQPSWGQIGLCEALAQVFGITPQGSDALFGMALTQDSRPDAVSKAEVFWNIDELMAGREALPYKATEEDVPTYALGIPNEGYSVDSHDAPVGLLERATEDA